MNHKQLKFSCIFDFLKSFSLTSAIWPTFLVLRGFSLIDVGISESVFHIVSMLGEIPTGMISDLYGRKFSRMLSQILNAAGTLLLLFANAKSLVYLAFALSALSYNLESGTDSAYIYDLLSETSEEHRFAKIQGIREVIRNIALLVGGVIGGQIANISYESAYVLEMVIIIISMLVLGKMKEIKNQNYQQQNVLQSVIGQFTSSYELVKKDHQILYLVMSYSLFSATETTCHYYLTNYWKSIGIDISFISYFLSMENIAGLIAGVIAYRLIKRLPRKKLLLYLPAGIVIASAGIPFFPISVVSICVMSFFETISYIAISTFLNELVDSAHRATLLSLLSMAFSIVMIIYFPIVGTIGEWFSLKEAFMFLTLFNAVIYLVYAKTMNKKLAAAD